VQRKHPLAGHVFFFGRFSSRIDGALRQTGQVFRFVNHQRIRIGFLEYVIGKFEGQQRHFFINLTQTGLTGFIQGSTGTHELTVYIAQQAVLFHCQTKVGPGIIEGFNPLEQVSVQVNIVVMFRQHRRYLISNLIHRLVGFVLRQSEKNQADFAKQVAGFVQGFDGVGKSGGFCVVRNGFDFLIVLLDPFIKGWQVVTGLDLFKGGNVVRGSVLTEERVVLCTTARDHHGSNQ